jgi:hypothetical protein
MLASSEESFDYQYRPPQFIDFRVDIFTDNPAFFIDL